MNLLRYGVLSMLVLTVVPFSAQAQTSSFDGSNQTTEIRQQGVRGWRRQSGDLEQKINTLPTTANASVLIPILFGVGVNNISPNFGDPRSGGARTHEGEDIMALSGVPIVSPTPAVVLRTGVGAGEGNYVYTANPGGETFVYMHLDKIGEGVVSGAVLAQGSLIGYVGNTGNASGGAAHLHLEIHDSSGAPTDPFPRLTAEIPLQEKIAYLTAILSQASDAPALSRLLVTHFRSTFTSALSANISLPAIIAEALLDQSANPVPVAPVSAGSSLPVGDLGLGASGSAVAVLQAYLIQADSGSAAKRLALAGATGNFGPMTQSALVEYQLAKNITPANGYYGLETRNFVSLHPILTVQPLAPVSTTPSTAAPLYRDLQIGSSGEDVRTLQKILNTHGYAVAQSGSGSSGNETIYFGPATRAAVVRFQIARGIVPAVGYVGPRTRSAFASL